MRLQVEHLVDVKLQLGGVSSFGTPPLIYIGGSHGAFGQGLQLYPLETTLGASEELPCIKGEVVGPMGQVGRPGRSVGLPEAPTAPNFVRQAVLGLFVLTPWVLAYPKQVCLSAWACFDSIEPDSCSLIGCAFCLDLWSVFPCS